MHVCQVSCTLTLSLTQQSKLSHLPPEVHVRRKVIRLVYMLGMRRDHGLRELLHLVPELSKRLACLAGAESSNTRGPCKSFLGGSRNGPQHQGLHQI
jgi:hypothetical protein